MWHEAKMFVPRGRSAWTCAALLLLLTLPRGALATDGPGAPGPLPEWTPDLDLLATQREKDLFSSLAGEAERRAFLQRFWQARDPFPQTSRNELRESWTARLAEAGRRWRGLADDRSRVFLLRGEPSASFAARCPSAGYEVWTYEPGFRVDRRIVLAFLLDTGGPARLWRPGASPDPRTTADEPCSNQEQLDREARWLRAVGGDGYDALLAQALAPPRPREWIAAFRPLPSAPAGAARLAADLEVAYVAPRDGEMVVRVLLRVAASSLPPVAPSAGGLEFAIDGETLRGGELVETFRFRLRGLPAGPAVPLSFERRLAPGEYLLRVRLEHLASRRAALLERHLAVPAPPARQLAIHAPQPVPGPPGLEQALAEADAALLPGPRLRLLQPAGRFLVGSVHVTTQVVATAAPAEQIERVAFTLDGKPLLTRNRPPFDLLVDLGPVPRLRKLRAEGLSGAGSVVAHDELLLNAAAESFRFHLSEPQAGRPYRRSLRIAGDVTVPPGAAVERVEVWFGEELVATLYQPPYSLPFALPREGQVGYVRAVAYLAGGGAAEDLVFVNTRTAPDEIDVRLVELFATVQDGQGRPVEGGLAADAFTVLEDGVRQSLREVAPVGAAPVRVAALIDSSASMTDEMAATRAAALGFLRSLLRPQDQAAVIAFNNAPRVTVPLTGDLGELERGIRTLLAEADTALYDSLAYTLLYLSTAQGQRAVLLLTDGEDHVSRLRFDQVLEVARRTGIAVHVLGLGVAGGSRGESGQQLARLARETGGTFHLLRSTAELAGVYAQIEQELRAQYKIVYQSSNTGTGDAFRAVQVQLGQAGLEARTVSGYYP